MNLLDFMMHINMSIHRFSKLRKRLISLILLELQIRRTSHIGIGMTNDPYFLIIAHFSFLLRIYYHFTNYLLPDYSLLQQYIISRRENSSMQSDQIKFMVATDVHLGHKEKHNIRKDDSFNGFQQVLQNAKKHEVDFLLLGGDLFDEVNPSKECFFRCLNILKQEVFGNRQVNLDVTLNGDKYLTNFSNKNFNVSLPIFTIHGNHDYPSNDFGKISVCDLLQASNYVNYFGKYLSLHQITIRPLIITKKGSKTKIALYGLGYIKDPIINDLFQTKKAVFEKPEGNIEEYLTIFVLHQNRFKKKGRTGVPISSSFSPKHIPEWINLTIWGHEHQAIYKTQWQFDRPIYQPGSTVLTSFIQTESFKKQCIIVNANGNKFSINSILLEKSYRPMVVLNLEVSTLKAQYGEEINLEKYLDETIADQIQKLKSENPEKKPIIRLKVEYTGWSQIARIPQLETKYSSMVANGEKIVSFWKRKQQKKDIPITEDEVFNSIRQKKIIPNPIGSLQEQLDNMLKKQLQGVQFQYFPQQFIEDLVSATSKQTSNYNAYIKKTCNEVDKKVIKMQEEKIAKMNRYKDVQFKKGIQYLYDKKQMYNYDKPPANFHGSFQQFQKLGDHLMGSQKYATYCKIMEESVAEPPNKSKSKLQVEKMPKKQIELEKEKQKEKEKEKDKEYNHESSRGHAHKHKKFSSFSDLGESEEDCCERANRQVLDEEGNQQRFMEAKAKLDGEDTKRLKKNAVPSRKQIKKRPPPPDPQKSVRFSQDLI